MPATSVPALRKKDKNRKMKRKLKSAKRHLSKPAVRKELREKNKIIKEQREEIESLRRRSNKHMRSAADYSGKLKQTEQNLRQCQRKKASEAVGIKLPGALGPISAQEVRKAVRIGLPWALGPGRARRNKKL